MNIEKKTKQLNTRVTPTLMRRIDAVLAFDEMSTAKWLTDLIIKDLEKRERALGIKPQRKAPKIPRKKARQSKYEFNR